MTWLEREELSRLHHACPDECRQALGLELLDTGAALVSMAEREPSILLNRALGLGARARVTREHIREVMGEFEARGIADYFIQFEREGVDASDDELRALGLQKARGWRRFEHRLESVPVATTDLLVREVNKDDDQEVQAFGRIVAETFGLSPKAAQLFAAAATVDLWTLFMSFDGATPAGTGGLLTARDPQSGTLCGWLDMGATIPAFRRRGGQFAVMVARLEGALAQGCRRLYTETGEAAPGDEQHSYKNILKCGFVEGSLKENWRPRRD